MSFTIWNRYLLKEFLKCFFLCIAAFYFLYMLLDYSSHVERFYFNQQFQWQDFLIYYSCEFLRRFGTLAPFALLVSCIKVLCQFSLHHEIIAMMASGFSTRRLLRPIIMVAFIMTLLMYLNAEFFAPRSIVTLNRINDAHKIASKSNRKHPVVQQVTLKDETTLLFQKYDSSRQVFSDVYWIKSIDDVFHMKSLDFSDRIPKGKFIDHFTRHKNGELLKSESFDLKEFTDMRFSKHLLNEIITPPEEQALSKLWKKSPKAESDYTEKQAQILAAFYNKMVFPWLCLIAVIAPAPFCIQFTRKLQIFFIYAFSIFGLVALIIVLNSSLIVGKRQLFSPFWITCLPFMSIFSYFSWRYVKLTA